MPIQRFHECPSKRSQHLCSKDAAPALRLEKGPVAIYAPRATMMMMRRRWWWWWMTMMMMMMHLSTLWKDDVFEHWKHLVRVGHKRVILDDSWPSWTKYVRVFSQGVLLGTELHNGGKAWCDHVDWFWPRSHANHRFVSRSTPTLSHVYLSISIYIYLSLSCEREIKRSIYDVEPVATRFHRSRLDIGGNATSYS